MKATFFKLPAIKRVKDGWLIYKESCKFTAWGIRVGEHRLQWRDSNGWCWRTGLELKKPKY